ncbi:C40 family peptidase [Sedimentitalea sp. HM32M-2]|uniref:C40 family peptidase n=1 Tax=Sedimentitalea sp. HM32M-2 TaxID=3351566 RepID=UPI00362F8920
MSDRRSTPMNARVAAAHLMQVPAGVKRVRPQTMRVTWPVVDLLRAPGEARDRQLLYGETVDRYETHRGHSFVQARKDGYVGYLPDAALGPEQTPTHWVSAPATHLYAAPDIKSPDRQMLSFGSLVTVRSETGAFVETAQGFVPRVHLRVIADRLDDPVAVARLFLGTPYLWGGNSRLGIDCSGLVQAALLACGHPCPGDSDQQQATLGQRLEPGTTPQRGDLLFWKGHVALVSGRDRLIHANAHHMAVRDEPLQAALTRIKALGDGAVTAHLRPCLPPASGA